MMVNASMSFDEDPTAYSSSIRWESVRLALDPLGAAREALL